MFLMMFYDFYKQVKEIIDESLEVVPISPPIPIPGVSKSPLPGGKQIENKTHV